MARQPLPPIKEEVRILTPIAMLGYGMSSSAEANQRAESMDQATSLTTFGTA